MAFGVEEKKENNAGGEEAKGMGGVLDLLDLAAAD